MAAPTPERWRGTLIAPAPLFRQLLPLAASVLVALLAASLPRAHAQELYRFVDGPPGPGINSAVYTGGPTGALTSAAPDAASFWITVNGRFVGYIAGAPVVVNEEFVEHFPEGIPANTPLLVVTPTGGAPPPASDEALAFSVACVPDPLNADLMYWHHCTVTVESGSVVSVTWTVTYTPQPGVTYEGETITYDGPTTRTFTFDQTYQSTISIEVEVCTPIECGAQHAFFDG